MKRRTVCLECETEKRLRIELSASSTTARSLRPQNVPMSCNNAFIALNPELMKDVIYTALKESYALQNIGGLSVYISHDGLIYKNVSQNVLAAYFISQFVKTLNNPIDLKAFMPYMSNRPNDNTSDIAASLSELQHKRYGVYYIPSQSSQASVVNQQQCYYDHFRRLNLYTSHFVDDKWVAHLMSRDIARNLSKNTLAVNVIKKQLQKVFTPLIESIFPFDLVSPTFPNYLLLDAVSLLRQCMCAFSYDNGLPPKEKLFLSILLQFNYLEILNHRNALYFLILLITSCLLLSCDLSEFSDTEINSAIFRRFYRIAQSVVSPNSNKTPLSNSEKFLISRELRHSRLLICKTLDWDINVGGIRQWLELLVTRMAVNENQQMNVFWISLYFEAEYLACEKKFCMNYIFDWTITHYQAAVQCLISAILKKPNFEVLLHLLNSVTAELAAI